jgi:hypothetical protein
MDMARVPHPVDSKKKSNKCLFFSFYSDLPSLSVASPCLDNSAGLGKNQLHRSPGVAVFLLACGGG